MNFAHHVSLVLLLITAFIGAQELPVTSLNARELGAVGDGQTDDTAALQTAIDRAAKVGELVLPAGNYLVNRTLVIDRTTGLIIRGEGTGALRGPYHPVRPGGVTSLTWNGPAGGVLIESRGNGALTLERLNLCGRNGDREDAGRASVLLLVTRPAGWGDMLSRFSSLSFFDAATGIQLGEKTSDHNCSDYLFEFITFRDLDTGFQVRNDQGVDYLFNYIFALSVGTVLEFQRGGNLLVNNAQMTGCQLFLDIQGGGRNAGTYVAQNVRIESGDAGRVKRFQLLRSYPKWRQANVKFVGYDDCQWDWKSNTTAVRTMPLCDIGPGTMVVIESSMFNSPVAQLTGAADAPANLILRECAFGFLSPGDAVAANEFGYFKLLNNLTDKMAALSDVEKWPARTPVTLPAAEAYTGAALAPSE